MESHPPRDCSASQADRPGPSAAGRSRLGERRQLDPLRHRKRTQRHATERCCPKAEADRETREAAAERTESVTVQERVTASNSPKIRAGSTLRLYFCSAFFSAACFCARTVHGGTIPFSRAYATSWPRCSCASATRMYTTSPSFA